MARASTTGRVQYLRHGLIIRQFSAEEEALLLERHAAGDSLKEIARKLSRRFKFARSSSSIYWRLRALGVIKPQRLNVPMNDVDRERILDLRRHGYFIRHIAMQIGRRQGEVGKVLQAIGDRRFPVYEHVARR